MTETETFKVKGHEIKAFNRKLSSYRRAIQIQNNIHQTLRSVGVPEDDIEIEIPRLVIRTMAASIEWWQDGYHLYFSCQKAGSYISNLHAISKILEAELQLVESGEKTMDQFLNEFSEEDDIEEQRKKARALLGVNEKCVDLEEINKAYKKLAMHHHPDRPEGSHEKFKAINNAHKILKRELQ